MLQHARVANRLVLVHVTAFLVCKSKEEEGATLPALPIFNEAAACVRFVLSSALSTTACWKSLRLGGRPERATVVLDSGVHARE